MLLGFTTKVGFDWPKTVTFRDLGYGTHTLAFINIHNGSMSIFCHLHCATNWFTTVLPRDFKFQGEGFAPGFAHCSERRLYPGHSYVAPGSAAWPTGISAWHLLIFFGFKQKSWRVSQIITLIFAIRHDSKISRTKHGKLNHTTDEEFVG